MNSKYLLISRDKRTADLFRKSWISAIKGIGSVAVMLNRRSHSILSFFYHCFICNRGVIKLIFGSAQILLCIPFCKRVDVFIFTGLGRYLMPKCWCSKPGILYLKSFYRGQWIIVLNEDDKKFFFENGFKNISVLNGEGFKPYMPGPLVKVNKDRLTFGYLGRLLHSKGVGRLISVFESNSSHNLLLVGDQDFGNADSVDVESINLKNIAVEGYFTDKRNFFKKIDVYVSLSEREGCSFSVMEAIFSGVRLVLSDVPGHRQFGEYPGVVLSRDVADYLNSKKFIALPQLTYSETLSRNERLMSEFGCDVIETEMAEFLIKHDAWCR